MPPEKRERKGLDAILVNDVLAAGCGFASETNTLRLICPVGEDEVFSGLKEDVARAVWSSLVGRGLFPMR